MGEEEKRPSKKNSMKENKKHPYKTLREKLKQFKLDSMKDANIKLKKWKDK